MEGKIDEIDRISNLPDFILHRMLSFLPKKDANQTCVLSKRWRFVWDTYPIFDLDQYIYIQDCLILEQEEFKQKTQKFMKLVDDSLKKFARYNLLMERLDLTLPLFDLNYSSLVDQWIALSLDSGVQELSLEIEKRCAHDDYYALRESTFVAKSMSGSSKLVRLQKLSLFGIQISETAIQNIVRHCPNLEHLHLKKIHGVKTIEISGLDKLEAVSIHNSGCVCDLERVDVDAVNLKHFWFSSGAAFNLTSCHDLKELHINSFSITDDLLHSCLSRFPFLEVLELNNCQMLQKVEISAQRLRSLRLVFVCSKIERIQVDAPTLSLFKYRGQNMPGLFLENVPCPVDIDLRVKFRLVADSSWFYELREFLGHSSQRKFLNLDFIECKVNFDREELEERKIPALVETDHLKLTCSFFETPVDYAGLMDGILWSCHPKMLSVLSNSMFQKDCIKVLCEKLLDREHPSCCDSSRIKCWRHHLKDVKIERFGEIKDERLLHSNFLLDILPSLGKEEEVWFKLDWDS